MTDGDFDRPDGDAGRADLVGEVTRFVALVSTDPSVRAALVGDPDGFLRHSRLPRESFLDALDYLDLITTVDPPPRADRAA